MNTKLSPFTEFGMKANAVQNANAYIKRVFAIGEVYSIFNSSLTVMMQKLNSARSFKKSLMAIGLTISLSACSSIDSTTNMLGDMVSLDGISETLGLSGPSNSNQGSISPNTQATPIATGSEISGSMDASAPAVLNVGDRFVFDNPEVTWQVVGRSGNAVYWQADNNDTKITDTNPILPSLEWRSADRGSGKRVISGLAGNMFPLEVGKTVSFLSSVTSDQPPYNWEYNWICTTTRIHTITTPLLGPIETYEIVCGRQSQDELVFDYSPQVGNYVRMEARGADGYGRTVRNLIAYSRAGSSMNLAGQSQANALNNGGATNNFTSSGTMNSMDQFASGGGFSDGQMGLLPSESLANPTSLYPQSGGNIISSAPGVSLDQGMTMGGANSNQQSTLPGFDMGLIPNNNGEGAGQSLFGTPPPSAGIASNTGNAGGANIAPLAMANVGGGQNITSNSGTGSGVLIHLASYRQIATAERGWRELSSQFGDILEGLGPVIREIDIDGKGIYQRLFAGPLNDEAEARDRCRRLQARGAYCAIIR